MQMWVQPAIKALLRTTPQTARLQPQTQQQILLHLYQVTEFARTESLGRVLQGFPAQENQPADGMSLLRTS